MSEEYIGKVAIDNEASLLYLGDVLSNNGSNMKNIFHKRNKSIGTQQLIPKLIKHLGPYSFKAAVIYN